MTYWLYLIFILTMSLLSIVLGGYFVYGIVKNKSSLATNDGIIKKTLLGRGKWFRVHLMIGVVGFTLGWVVLLIAFVLNL
jgi:hypothetical protein